MRTATIALFAVLFIAGCGEDAPLGDGGGTAGGDAGPRVSGAPCDVEDTGHSCPAECRGYDGYACCSATGGEGRCWQCDPTDVEGEYEWRQVGFFDCYTLGFDAASDASPDAPPDSAVDAFPDAAL